MTTTLHWNTVLMELSRRDHSQGYAGGTQSGPTRTSRAMAITHIAIYNAVMAKIHPERYYKGRSKVLAPPTLEGQETLAAMIDGAASFALKELYHRQTQFITEATASSSNTPGFKMGEEIASEIFEVDMRGDDKKYLKNGAAKTTEYSGYGEHKVDPFDPTQVALSKDHGLVQRFCADQPAPMAGFPGSVAAGKFPENLLANDMYRADYEEVYSKGALNSTTRTPEEKLIGTFWGYDGAQGIGVPPRLYNQIVRTIMNNRINTAGKSPEEIEVEHCTILAKVHAAMADAGIDAWLYKYMYNLWRPVVGIRNELHTEKNATPDAFWAPLGVPQTNRPGNGPRTPGFPSYPSGHATFGAATFQVLAMHFDAEITIDEVRTAKREDVVGKQRFTFVSDELDGVSVDADGSVRTKHQREFGNYASAIKENAESRVYLGVHWRFDGLPPVDAKDDDLKIGGVPLGLAVGRNTHKFFEDLKMASDSSVAG